MLCNRWWYMKNAKRKKNVVIDRTWQHKPNPLPPNCNRPGCAIFFSTKGRDWIQIPSIKDATCQDQMATKIESPSRRQGKQPWQIASIKQRRGTCYRQDGDNCQKPHNKAKLDRFPKINKGPLFKISSNYTSDHNHSNFSGYCTRFVIHKLWNLMSSCLNPTKLQKYPKPNLIVYIWNPAHAYRKINVGNR